MRRPRARTLAALILSVSSLAAFGTGAKPVATAPATPTTSPSVEVSSPSAAPTTTVIGPLGYDTLTFEGFNQDHPATIADFKPIPKDATPQQIIDQFDSASNKIIASADPNLWSEVRNLYVDTQPTQDGSQYSIDKYIADDFSAGHVGYSQSGGPLIASSEATHSYTTHGVDGTPIIVIESTDMVQGYSSIMNKMVTLVQPMPGKLAYAYKTDLKTSTGKTTSGWVEVDPGNYGVTN